VQIGIRNSESANYQLIILISSFFDYRGCRIHYRVIGEGNRVTVCFHGFGEHAGTFDLLAEAMPGHRLVAIDLPFHGQTPWKEGLPFLPADLWEILQLLPEIGSSSFGLLGYSMGGRVALAMLECMPDRISHVLLLAPDGLTFNPWYALATRTVMGNRLFKFTMNRPDWFRGLVKLGARLRMVNASVERYVERYIEDPARRRDLYRIWTTLSGFRPSVTQVARIIREKAIPTQLVFGRYDRIIPPTAGRRLQQQAGPTCTTTILEGGHGILHKHHLSSLSTIFQASVKLHQAE
jgi:pimeloyl-ACP methyl ester carboxylesterase